MKYEKDIIEKVNKDYLEIYQSQRYKLGDLLFEILNGASEARRGDGGSALGAA